MVSLFIQYEGVYFMVNIDYERLELVIGSYIHESVRAEFDIPAICRSATTGTFQGRDAIFVKSSKFVFIIDSITYEQLHGAGV